MSTGACILAHFTDPEKLIPAAAKLTADDAITRWDAVDGHVQLVAWAADVKSARTAIAGLAGVDQVTAYESPSIANMAAPQDTSQCYAYVFLEVEESKLDAVAASLKEIPEIIATVPARGGCDLIALVAGDSFSQVDGAIRDRVRPLDGVLRLKQNRIIDLKQL